MSNITEDLEPIFNRTSFYFSLSKRRNLLKRMKQMIVENEQALLDALHSDLGKPVLEAYTSEIAVLLNEIDFISKHLKKWMKPISSKHVKLGYLENIKTTRQAFGKVLIISPWNYPLQLALMPAVSAISAGNICVIKPSELAASTSTLLKNLIDTYFSPDDLHVINGDAKVAQQLIDLNFDFVFFTGSESVGKKVYKQASEQLKPVAMELGGKNACILDETAFTKHNVREIVWGKFLNAGQTCVAPDTLFVHESIYMETLSELKKVLVDFYGDIHAHQSGFGRIINHNHFHRLKNLLTNGVIYCGGHCDANTLVISPTIMTDIEPSSGLMQSEVFGPILPVIPFKNMKDLLNSGLIQSDALTNYLFSTSSSNVALLNQHVKSTISINQVIHHAACTQVPFGGIGKSGFGAYHGKAGFEVFTHLQTYYRAHHYKSIKRKYPPYSDNNYKLVKLFRKWLS